MKYLKTWAFISIVAYSVIILKGQMIGLPLLLWLLLSVFDFGSPDQLFSILAVAGLIITLKNRNKNRTQKILLADLLCFILLAAPIAGRLSMVPLTLFNYSAFTIPLSVFVLSYFGLLVCSCKVYLSLKRKSIEK